MITQYLSWHYVFWINLPIAFFGLLMSLWIIPKSKGKKIHFDWMGFFTSCVGISSIIIALMQAKVWGWASFWTLGLLFFGSFILFLLWKIDREVKEPYIDFSLYRNVTFNGANIGIFCTQFLLMITVFWAIYFQNVLGYSPSQAGILNLLANMPIMIAAPLGGGHLLDRKGPRVPITIGFSLVIVSTLWFMQNLDIKNAAILLSAIIPFGCGIPFIFTPNFATALAEIPPERRGLVSGKMGMLRQLGGMLGLTLLGSLFLHVQTAEFAKDLKQNVATENIDPLAFQGLLSKTPEALNALEKAFVKQSLIHATTDGFWSINVLVIVMALIGLSCTLILIKKNKPPAINM